MPGFGSHIEYDAGIMRWCDDFYVWPSNGIR